MAKIYTPLRGQHSADTAFGAMPRSLVGSEAFWPRADRVGAQPVTNKPPSGPLTKQPAGNESSAQEQGWLALLEIVFDETGWPDA
ncbi:MAG: hypothetical protein ABI377_07620 [Devosia sp.]